MMPRRRCSTVVTVTSMDLTVWVILIASLDENTYKDPRTKAAILRAKAIQAYPPDEINFIKGD